MNTCGNCKHWIFKVDAGHGGYGKCINDKNKTRVLGIAALKREQVDDWVIHEIEDGIRYPENFGCIFFEHQ